VAADHRGVKSRILADLRYDVLQRDDLRCVGPRIGMPGTCHFILEVDHVRASGGLGMKSRTDLDNLVVLCRDHHRLKTENGRTWRPKLLVYLDKIKARDAIVERLAADGVEGF
jgi:5-methylcytosine-specific restriction endonuclease McrA